MDYDILHYLVEIPMAAVTPLAIAAGVDAWNSLISQKRQAEVTILSEVSSEWLSTIRAGKGLFSTSMKWVSLVSLSCGISVVIWS
jgi:phosphatidylinositol 4-kinase